VTSSRRLSRFDGTRWSSWRGDERFPISHLHAVTTDRNGRAWAGSLHGLFALDEATARFERFSTSSGALSVDWVTSVTTFGGTLVAGTYHGGLTLYDGTRFTRIREGERGLSSGWINPHAITAIDDRLFAGTLDRGLLVGTRDERGELRFTTLRIADGLPSDDVTDVLADGERSALVATRAGLSRVSW
jgi:ligand-binding sensor domain-containing protein